MGLQETFAVSRMRHQRNRASVFRVAKPGHGIDRDGRRMGEGFPRSQPAKRVGIWEACLELGSSAASFLYGARFSCTVVSDAPGVVRLQDGAASI